MIIKNKAARTRQLVFSILLSFVLLSCEESGTVGAGFISESEVTIDTLTFNSSSVETINAYTGKLAVTPAGKFADALYGNLAAVSYMKPGISNSASLEYGDSVSIKLNLKFNETNVFGDTLTESTFAMYKISEQWRGAAMQQNNPLMTEMVDGDPAANRIVQFSTADMDTSGYVRILMPEEWEAEYLQYYNNDEDERDSTYFYENFGLAIVAEEQTNTISYVQYGSSNLHILTPNSKDTITVPFQDWAYNFEQEGSNVPATHFSFNTLNDPFLMVDLENVAESIDNQNFVRAEVVFYPDTTLHQESLGANEVRSNTPVLLFQTLETDDLAYELGFSNNPTVASYIDDSYRINITGDINNYLFGSTEVSRTAIYMAQNSGYLGFNTVFGTTADPALRPVILIFNIEK